jgi:hypothetical protein
MARKERWRICAIDPNYAVSNLGQVARWTDPPQGKSKQTGKGRILIPYDNNFGWLQVKLTKGRQKLVHLLVMEAFIGSRPLGHVANHRNGNRHDNRASNLRWITQSDANRCPRPRNRDPFRKHFSDSALETAILGAHRTGNRFKENRRKVAKRLREAARGQE